MPKETFNLNKNIIRNITLKFSFEIKIVTVFPCLNKYKFSEKVKSNEQQVKSKEQRVKSNEKVVTSNE